MTSGDDMTITRAVSIVKDIWAEGHALVKYQAIRTVLNNQDKPAARTITKANLFEVIRWQCGIRKGREKDGKTENQGNDRS